MVESIIGLHIYAVRVHASRNPATLKLSSADGSRLAKFAPQFFDTFSNQVDGGDDGNVRSWYLEVQPSNASTFEGVVRYGSSGFSEEIRDRKSKKLKYNRLPSDIGTIPLYYRLWIPNAGSYALLALQTFGARSCVGLFTRAFSEGFRSLNSGFHLTFPPVVPAQLASFKAAEVKSFNLIKHDYSSDAAENQLEGADDLVDLNVSFRAKRRGNLGLLSNFTDRIKRIGQDEVLEYNDTQFDEAVAEVMIQGKRRKVTLIGISQNTGKFDITEDVQRVSGHPTFQSISAEVEKLFKDVIKS